MTTIFTKVTTTKGNSRCWRVFRLGTAAPAAALMLSLIASGDARAQEVSPLQIIPQAQGFTTDTPGRLRVNGPSDVLQALLVFQPGAETGWHIHPGPVVVVVKSGAITETHANGCVTVHPAGSVFFEKADEVHNAANQTGGVAEVFATFLSPAGSHPLIPVPNPGRVCRGDDHDGDDHDRDDARSTVSARPPSVDGSRSWRPRVRAGKDEGQRNPARNAVDSHPNAGV